MTEIPCPFRLADCTHDQTSQYRGRRVLYDVHKAETPTIPIFSKADIAAAIGSKVDDFLGPDEEAPRVDRSTEEQSWFDTLQRIMNDPRGAQRPILRADQAMELKLRERAATSPHFAVVTALIGRAMALSRMSGQRLSFPPLLLLGSPGIGKTHYAQEIARSLGTGFVSIAMNLMSDKGQLTGTNRSWKAARMGALATGLLACPTAAPVFFLDEVDKVSDMARDQPYNALLSALEEANARAFTDDYLEIPLRLDHSLWVMTANDTSPIPDPILDRMLVLTVPDPSPEQARIILASVYGDIVRPYAGLFAETLDVAIVDHLVAMNTRGAKRVLGLSLGFAAQDGRSVVKFKDITDAELICNKTPRQAVGFL